MCLAYYLAAPCKNALTHKKGTTVLRQCPSAYCKQLHRKLDRAEGRVDSQQDNTLCAVHLALDEGGHGHDEHDGQHDRQIEHQARVNAEERRALRDGERRQRDGNTADQHKVEDVCADDVADGQIAVTLDKGGNCRDQLRQRGAQRDEGQGDDALGHAQRLRNQRTVIDEQVRTDGDDRCADDQQDQRLRQGHQILFLGVLLGGGVLHLPDVGDHVGHEHGQHDKAHRAGKFTKAVGSYAVDGGSDKEEDDRRFQRLRVNLAGADGNRDGGNQRRVADDRTDGVPVGDLAVAGHSRHRGDHDLRQRCADGNDRRADQQLRQVETPCQRRCAVHEPVAALNQEQQTDDKE